MKNKLTKTGMMIVAAVLLVAMAFAGAASATDIDNLNDYNTNIATSSSISAGTYYIKGSDWTIPSSHNLTDALTISGNVVLDFTGFTGGFAGIPTATAGDNKGGLFGNVKLAGHTLEIVGLNMTSVNVTSSGKIIGGILGYVDDSGTLNFTNCHLVNCSITGGSSSDNVGGLVGSASSASVNVEDCCVKHCDVVSGSYYGGGLVGNANSASVVRSNVTNSTVASTNSDNVGGLVGYADSASFETCGVENTSVYARSYYVGGLVGRACSASGIGNCLVKNCVIASTNSDTVGGLVGYADSAVNKVGNCRVLNCTIKGSSRVGGLVGYAYSASDWSNNEVLNSAVSGSATMTNLVCGNKPALMNPLNCTADVNQNFIYNGTISDTITPTSSYGWNTIQYVTGQHSGGSAVTVTNLVGYGVVGGYGVKSAPTLSYDANGATGTAPANQTYASGSQVTVADQGSLAMTGYEFNGWTVGSTTGALKKAGETITITADTTLYAKWTLPTYVEVSDWDQLVANVSSWTDTTTMRTIVLTNTATGAYKNTTVSSEYVGIPVTGLITITPAAGTGEITIDANGMGRLFYVNGGNLTLTGNSSSATLNLTGAYIGDNGGGIIIATGGTLTLNTGVNITNCTSTLYGGGVYVEDGIFNMSGGSITGCCANAGGGGVLVFSGTFNVNGTATITGNTGGTSQTSNVLLASSTGLHLLAGGFTGNIGLSVYSVTSAVGDIFGTAASGATGAGKFFADDNATLVGSISGTNLVWGVKPVTYVEVNSWAGLNKSISEWTDTDEARTVAVNASILDRVAGNETDGIEVNGKIILTTTASPLTGSEAVVNGNGIGRLFNIVISGGDLTICGNGSATLNLTGGNMTGQNGGCIKVMIGNLTLETGVEITNCSAPEGGGIYVTGGGKLTINGGKIADCSATYNGGGIRIDSGTNTMNDGEITGCSATSFGGGIYLGAGSGWCTFTMTGGSITTCESPEGGGVYLDSRCRFSMTGGSITGCTGPYSGALLGYGVNAATGSSMFNVSGTASIYDNKNGTYVSNVLVGSSNSCLNLVDNFNGKIGISGNAGFAAGDSFGNATGAYSGAEKFFADEDATLVGSISNGKLVWVGKSSPSPSSSSGSSSRHAGGSQMAPSPTAEPTVAPTEAPTPVPTADAPSASSGSAAQPTQSSPAPFVGLIAGLGAAAVVLARLRR